MKRLFIIALLSMLAAAEAPAQVMTFDFDTGTPPLSTGQNVPFDQVAGGLTAHFSAATGAFSIQNNSSTFLTLSDFSGNYVYPNAAGSVLVIGFSQPITNVFFNFATAEQTPIENPTPIQLVTYTNSVTTPPVGSTSQAGKYSGANTLPMGIVTFISAVPFDLLKISIGAGGATGFLIDNLTVQTSGAPAAPVLQTSIAAGGPFADDLTATVDAAQDTITVALQPAPQFYRLRSSVSTRIVQFRTVNGQAILNYQ